MAQNDGGPAFPPFHDPKNHDSGMSLREWYAGMALQGIMASGALEGSGTEAAGPLGRACCLAADALISALSEEGGSA